jgi:hypothetical protein
MGQDKSWSEEQATKKRMTRRNASALHRSRKRTRKHGRLVKAIMRRWASNAKR